MRACIRMKYVVSFDSGARGGVDSAAGGSRAGSSARAEIPRGKPGCFLSQYTACILPLPSTVDSDSLSKHVSYCIVSLLSTRAGIGCGYSVLVDGHGESVVLTFKMNADLLLRTQFAGGHVPSYNRIVLQRSMLLVAGIFHPRSTTRTYGKSLSTTSLWYSE